MENLTETSRFAYNENRQKTRLALSFVVGFEMMPSFELPTLLGTSLFLYLHSTPVAVPCQEQMFVFPLLVVLLTSILHDSQQKSVVCSVSVLDSED